MIASLFKDYKPLGFFSILALIFLIIGLAVGIPVVAEFNQTHLVPRLPSAIVAVAFCGLAALLFVCGLILDTEVKGHRRDWELAVMREYEEERRIHARRTAHSNAQQLKKTVPRDVETSAIR